MFQPFCADRYARAWTNGAVFVHLTLTFWAPVCSFIWVGFYLAIFSVSWEQSDYPSTWNRIKRLSITQAQLLNQPSQSAKPAVSEKRACKNLSFICVLTKMQGKHKCVTFPEVKQLTPVGCFFSCRPTQWWKIQSGHTQLVCLRRLYFYMILDFFFSLLFKSFPVLICSCKPSYTSGNSFWGFGAVSSSHHCVERTQFILAHVPTSIFETYHAMCNMSIYYCNCIYTHTPTTLLVWVHLLKNTPGRLTKIKQRKRKKTAWSEGSQFLWQYSDSKARIWCKQHEKMESSCLVSAIQATGAVIIFWRIFSWQNIHVNPLHY